MDGNREGEFENEEERSEREFESERKNGLCRAYGCREGIEIENGFEALGWATIFSVGL